MIQLRTMLLATLAVFLLAAPSYAITVFEAVITNAAENPPANPTNGPGSGGAPRSSGGTAMFVLNDAQTELTMTATIFGMDITGLQTPDIANDNLSAAHIHVAPNLPPATPNAGGVVWGFFGSPQNDTTPNDRIVTPLAMGVGGTFEGKWDAAEGNGTTLTAQLTALLAGRLYINFHTTQFGAGEARGFITVVPEPSSIVLCGLGAIGLAGMAIRRRRAA